MDILHLFSNSHTKCGFESKLISKDSIDYKLTVRVWVSVYVGINGMEQLDSGGRQQMVPEDSRTLYLFQANSAN